MSWAAIALVESNTSGTGRLFARIARRLGLRPVLLCREPARYRYAAEDGLAVIEVDTGDEEALVEACRRSGGEGFRGIFSSSEYFIATAAALAQRLGLPGPRPEAIRGCRDKVTQRLRLLERGVPGPIFAAASSVAEARRAAATLGPPVVVKPILGTGSIGVRLCQDLAEVAAHAERLLVTTHNERGLPIPGPRQVLVESVLEGPEYSVETFDRAVVGVTRKHLGAPPHFVEVGHEHPAQLADDERARLEEVALAALGALELGWGPAHIELRLTPAGPRIVEVNPRLAGGFIPELVRLSTGIDLIAETLRRGIGHAPRLERRRRCHAAIQFLVAPADGWLAAVHGLEAARALPYVTDVALYDGTSRPLRRQGDFRDRLGHVIAASAAAATTRAAVRAAQEHITLAVVPEAGDAPAHEPRPRPRPREE